MTSYGGLRQANVAGTRELLRLACTARPKAFQFVSSLSVCYAVGGPAVVTETTDMLPHAADLPLGYAQSKCVAESLVRQAAARGLPATIVRPSLIVGDAATGAANTGDLVAVLLKGCIEMGAAPDLDWVFDAVPVDVVARAVVRAARQPVVGLQTYHLAHPRPRHWRECVPWTNLFGYPVVLEPYHIWIERLRECSTRPGHPLHGLRGFFLRQVAGRTAPEHLEAHTRSRVDCSRARGGSKPTPRWCIPRSMRSCSTAISSTTSRAVIWQRQVDRWGSAPPRQWPADGIHRSGSKQRFGRTSATRQSA